METHKIHGNPMYHVASVRGDGPSPEPSQDTTPIAGALNRLCDAISSVEKSLDELENGIGQILAPVATAANLASGISPDVPRSPMAEIINNQAVRVEGLLHHVRELITRNQL